MNERLSLLLWYAGWPLRQVLLLPIKLYRATASRILGDRCRFYPSCSAYAQASIARAGAIRGLGLTIWRVLRCSPLTAGGVDHPPVGRTWSRLHPHEPVRQMAEVAT